MPKIFNKILGPIGFDQNSIAALKFAHELADTDRSTLYLPASAIVTAAEELDVHLIVMPTHGRKGLEHTIMGSVAERVVREARWPYSPSVGIKAVSSLKEILYES